MPTMFQEDVLVPYSEAKKEKKERGQSTPV